jgi:hypothetical protein
MNDLIKELAIEAGMIVGEANGFDMAAIMPKESKFAELIVRECICALWTEECHNSDLALEEFERNSAKIKEHFGVE